MCFFHLSSPKKESIYSIVMEREKDIWIKHVKPALNCTDSIMFWIYDIFSTLFTKKKIINLFGFDYFIERFSARKYWLCDQTVLVRLKHVFCSNNMVFGVKPLFIYSFFFFSKKTIHTLAKANSNGDCTHSVCATFTVTWFKRTRSRYLWAVIRQQITVF